MKKPSMVFAALALAAAPLSAQVAGVQSEPVPTQLTLDEAIAIALRNNGAYRRLTNDAEVAEANRRSAFARMLPRPGGSFSTNAGPARSESSTGTTTSQSSGTSVGFNLGLTVFDGGQSLTSYRQSKMNIERVALSLAEGEQTVRANVINQYYRAQLADSTLALERRVLVQRKQDLELTDMKFLKALMSLLDKQRAVEAVQRQENAVLNAIDGLERNKLELLRTLGVSGSTTFSLVSPIPAIADSIQLNTDSIVQLALRQNPAVRQQELALEQTRMNTKLTHTSRFMPAVGLTANYSRSISGQGYDSFLDPGARTVGMNGSLGISFNFTRLLDFTATSANLKAADAQLDDARSTMRDQNLNIAQQARLAVISLRAAYRQLAMSRAVLAGVRLQVQVANDQLRVGQINGFDFQDVMDNASAAERQVLDQQLNVLASRISLDLLLGNRPGG